MAGHHSVLATHSTVLRVFDLSVGVKTFCCSIQDWTVCHQRSSRDHMQSQGWRLHKQNDINASSCLHTASIDLQIARCKHSRIAHATRYLLNHSRPTVSIIEQRVLLQHKHNDMSSLAHSQAPSPTACNEFMHTHTLSFATALCFVIGAADLQSINLEDKRYWASHVAEMVGS